MKVEDTYLSLLKDGVEVARAGVDDGEEPSSMSLLFRDTVDEDS